MREDVSDGFILSVALHGDRDLAALLAPLVDRVHLMAYDFCRSLPCDHATYDDAMHAYTTLLDAGVPAERLLLGMPAYGRNRANPAEAVTFADLVRDYSVYDEHRDVTDDGAIYFNNRATVVRKAQSVAELGGGGVFFWEAGQDASDAQHSLLAAVHARFHEQPQTKDEL